MEEKAVKAFTEAVQQEIFARLHVSNPRDLGGFENFVYEVDNTIIRISHESHRTVQQLEAELMFIDALALKGAPVCRPLHAIEDQWIVSAGEFHACRFERAIGGPLPAEPYPEVVIRHWGEALGQFHAIAMQGLPGLHRDNWRDDANHDFVRRIPIEQDIVIEKGLALLRELSELPEDPSVFGLIHSDAHTGNFFVTDDGEITVFDFDDCLYAWFGYDLATILLGLLLQPWAGEDDASKQATISAFMTTFLEGYAEQCPIESLLLDQLPLLIKLREFSLYAVIHAHEMQITPDSMAGRFMVDRRQRMEQGLPFIDYDFGRHQ